MGNAFGHMTCTFPLCLLRGKVTVASNHSHLNLSSVCFHSFQIRYVERSAHSYAHWPYCLRVLQVQGKYSCFSVSTLAQLFCQPKQ